MKTMKKVISVLMMVCILASFMTVAAYADEVAVPEITGLSEVSGKDLSSANGKEFNLAAKFAVPSGKSWSDYEVLWSTSNSALVNVTKSRIIADGSNAITVYTGTNDSSSAVTATVTAQVREISSYKTSEAKSVTLTFPATKSPDPTPAPAGTITATADTVMVGNSIMLDVNMTSGAFNFWEVDAMSSGSGSIDIAKNRTVNFKGISAGKVTVKAYASDGTVFATKEITVTAPRTLEVTTNVSRIDNGEVAWFYVKNAKSTDEVFTWSYSTTPATLSIVTATSSASAPNFSVTGGKGNGNVTVTATSANGETGSVTVPVNSLGYGDATLSPTNVTWAKGQGNLTFTVSPLLYSAYMDDVCFTGSGNTSKYNYVYSSSNLVINSSFLATLSAGQHVLRVDTVDANGNNAGTQYAYITVSGTASAAYGDNAHVRGTTSDLYFTANSAINSVTISGTTIDPANYTLSNNGKTITLKANFLNLLNYGSYTMKLGNTNGGTETATFRVVTANYAPATGDESNLAIWIAVMVISGAGAIALIPRKKKEM